MQRSVLLSALFLWMVLWSCGGQMPAAAEEKRMADILITQADRGRERQVLPGQRVLMQLPESPATGYQWQIEAFDPRVMATAGSDFVAASDGRLGGGGTRTFVFTALAPGDTLVRLRYRRPWESKSQEGESFEVRIIVQMKAQP